MTVFNVYLLFDQNVYKTTYVNQANKAYTAVSIVVNNKNINPITEKIIPKLNTNFKEKFPVTVGRIWVRFISLSKSTSYQLFKISAPDINNVLPIARKTKVSQ